MTVLQCDNTAQLLQSCRDILERPDGQTGAHTGEESVAEVFHTLYVTRDIQALIGGAP